MKHRETQRRCTVMIPGPSAAIFGVTVMHEVVTVTLCFVFVTKENGRTLIIMVIINRFLYTTSCRIVQKLFDNRVKHIDVTSRRCAVQLHIY